MNLSSGIYILDGAMGTMLQRKGLSGCSEIHNLQNPQTVLEIHREYIRSGADIIETNTFGANPITQAEHGYADLAGEMAYQGALLARKAADEATGKVYVAGSVGPTSKSLSIGTDADDSSLREVSFDEMTDSYRVQTDALIRGGVDFILIETCFDALNAKAAIKALENHPEVPVMVSAAVSDLSGRVLTGQTLEAFYTSIKHCKPIAFGLNCSLGAQQMKPLMEEVASFAECPVICFPNAGLPNEMGQYDQTPAQMASGMKAMEGLLNIAGGCCGTTPGHIKAIAQALRDTKPRTLPSPKRNTLTVSGLQSVTIDLENNNFTNIGERTNVAGSRKFAKLIAAGNYQEALNIAASQIENGASVIDVNMDDAMLCSRKEMEKFVRMISGEPSVAKAALMIDSSDWDTILAGIKNSQGKCIVNSISLKEGEDIFLRKALEIKSLGAAMVVMAFDEEGQATVYERKIAICRRAYKLLTEAGIEPQDIIFDVNVLSVGTGVESDRRYGVDFIEAVRWIKRNLPGAKTSGGISNLSFAFRGNNPIREAMHSAFLYHAVNAGLDMAIVNPGMLRPYDQIEPSLLRAVEDVILDRDPEATGRLLAKATENPCDATAGAAKTEDSMQIPVRERLVNAILKGVDTTLDTDLQQALGEYDTASEIIEGPLMEGMEKVGGNFACGKMFLPQVVKSARVMKQAVQILNPYILREGSSANTSSRNVIVIATVKGDVHDIGKNITATVLTCNGFQVHDLGVMVDRETILSRAAEYKAEIICASGLITPSLVQMEELCREMSARGLDTPLFVGGATTSALHTAVKLAQLYPHVFHSSDASSSAVMAKKCISDRVSFEKEEHDKQNRIRELYTHRNPVEVHQSPLGHCLPYSQVDENWNLDCTEVPAGEIIPEMDWNTFFAIWGIKASDTGTEEAVKIKQEALEALNCINFDIRAGVRFLPARRKGPFIKTDGGRRSLRAPVSAFLSDSEDGAFGVFAASVRCGCKDTCGCCGDDYEKLLHKTLCLTLCDAVSDWLGKRITPGPGYKVIRPGIGYRSCPDHSQKKDVLELLPESSELGITLTESFAMLPLASVCGFIIINTEAKYF